MPPGAAAPVTGLLAQFMFLGGVWDKLDIDMQVVKIREYKTFGDMLANKEMTPYHREMADSLLDSMYGQLVDGIAAQPGLSPRRCARRSMPVRRRRSELQQAAASIDGAKYLDELPTQLTGPDGEFVSGRGLPAARRQPLPGRAPVQHRVALVYGVGTVTTRREPIEPVRRRDDDGRRTRWSRRSRTRRATIRSKRSSSASTVRAARRWRRI